ncbi:Domain of uncharacterised function (DUF2825) [Salmonella enterica]|uniref:Domain of uncharacterized function (DUF2825) n=1 Tax=Salmonella enterica TaxID=28901 RepID=A0A7D8IKD7_SALER|nr:Domain of uncharacterised function (DUF2825) [Salmonella enterica]
MSLLRNSSVNGLSPLARGTLVRQLLIEYALRFIPAGAGNTKVKAVIKWFEDGLSPLARGTHKNAVLRLITERFIPAGAGNTISPSH